MVHVAILAAVYAGMVHTLLIVAVNRLLRERTAAADWFFPSATVGLMAWAAVCGYQAGLWWAGIWAGCVAFAFRRGKDRLLRTGLFFLLMTVIGEVTAGRIWPFILGGGVWILLWLAGGANRCRETVEVTIVQGEKSVELRALVDTGNRLVDPVSGDPVLVVEPEIAGTLFGISPEAVRDPVGTLACTDGAGLRLIPFRSVGQAGGFLLGVRPYRVMIDGRECRQVVAFAPHRIGDEFQALTGGSE